MGTSQKFGDPWTVEKLNPESVKHDGKYSSQARNTWQGKDEDQEA